ncbi:MAG: hypothetical protein R3B13_15375 [Polyangiaceae bacterium]
MLKLDASSKQLVPVLGTSLKQSNILERADLQTAIEASWDSFTAELGFDELFLVGSEVVPHESCRDRIDLLGLRRDGTPIVFELKRDRDKLQLLQAISYAAMVAKWDAQRFQDALGARSDEGAEELRSLLRGDAFELRSPEIVLVAESFDPEVILAADWLGNFEVPISAFALTAVEHEGATLISLDQRFPLFGLDDVYTRRAARVTSAAASTSWDEVLEEMEFPFAQRALDVFRKHSDGNADRRAFFSIYAGSPLGRMRISFRKKYLKIYTTDQSPEAEAMLKERLTSLIPLSTWGSEKTTHSGFTFSIETEQQFEQFLRAVGELGG